MFNRISIQVNPRILAGAVSVAVFLWLYVKLSETYEYRMEIPVQVAMMHPQRSLSMELPPTVTVRVQGLGSSLAGMIMLWGRNLAFAMDLSHVSDYWACPTNEHRDWITFPLDFDDLLTSEIVEPDTIHVDVEPMLVRRLQIRETAVLITPEPGYIQVGSLRFQPDTVSIKGPRSLVRRITEIGTDTLRYEGVEEPFTDLVTLVAPETPLVSMDVTQVTMYADIQKLGERTLGNVPVMVTQAPPGWNVRTEPETVDLVIRGGVEFIRTLDPSQLFAYIPYQPEWERFREYRLEVTVDAPTDIIDISATPRIFTVIIP